MYRVLTFLTLVAFVCTASLSSTLNAGISVESAPSNRLYTNFDSVYHGTQNGLTNFLGGGTDQWFIVLSSPSETVGVGFTSMPTLLNSANGAFSLDGKTATWHFDIPPSFGSSSSPYSFDVTLSYDFVGENLVTSGSITATNVSGTANSPLTAILTNTFEYNLANGDLFSSSEVTPDNGAKSVTFSDGATTTIQRNASSGGAQLAVTNGLNTNGSNFSDTSGAFTWEFTANLSTGQSNEWNFGTSTSINTFSSVPEPTSMAYALLAGVGFLVRRRR